MEVEKPIVTALLRLSDNRHVLPYFHHALLPSPPIDSDVESIQPIESVTCESVIYICDVPPPDKYLEDDEEEEYNDTNLYTEAVMFMSCVKDSGDHFLVDEESADEKPADDRASEVSDDDFFDAHPSINMDNTKMDETIRKVVIDDDVDADGNPIIHSVL